MVSKNTNTDNKNNFISALKGINKIKRIRIRIDRSVIEDLKSIKIKIGSSLELYEMVECCYDYFDFKSFNPDLTPCDPKTSEIISALEKKKEGVQINIREDIFETLNRIKDRTGVPIQTIMSKIILFQLKEIYSHI